MDLTTEQLTSVLQSALEVFRAEFDSDITAARILTLLAVAQNPGAAQAEFGRLVPGLSQSAVSRNLLDWSELNSSRKSGPDFIAQRPDPSYRKRNLIYPTPKGQAFLDRLTGIANGSLKKTGGRA